MPARERLNPVEQYLAYLIGLGIALAMIAALLIGFGGASSTSTTAMLVVGLALAVIGIIAWLAVVRPWTQFDDLKTPHYTGHDAHEHEEHALSPEAAWDAAIPAPPAEPETADEAALDDAVPATPAEPVAGDLTASVPAPPAEPETADEAALDDAVPARPATPPADTLESEVDSALAVEEAALETQLDAALNAERPAPPAGAASAPAALERDNLLVIEGLGPKSQEVLYAAGITTYRAIAESSPEALANLIRGAGLRLVRTETWPQQAGLLAAGDQTGFQAFRESLRSGRGG